MPEMYRNRKGVGLLVERDSSMASRPVKVWSWHMSLTVAGSMPFALVGVMAIVLDLILC